MFAALVIERERAGLEDVPALLLSWVQNAGGFAAFAVAIWVVVYVLRRPAATDTRRPSWVGTLILVGVLGTVVGYVVYGLASVPTLLSEAAAAAPDPTGATPPPPAEGPNVVAEIGMTVGGAFALFTVGLPFLLNLGALRGRRVWAMARLSFKEAVRRRVLWVFSAMLLVILFGSWFITSKPEDQVRTYVWVVFLAMSVLLLVTASLLAAFSIPTDMRNQTSHTILTKPVERLEYVLGRFLGHALLMTLVLAVMALVSLVYIFRGVNPDAAAESLKARQPLWGTLEFEGTKEKHKAENVGREWDYRSYISAAHPQAVAQGVAEQAAIWSFPRVPAALGDRDRVRCEFTFDIYRTTKGSENRGVYCTFTFQTAGYDPAREEERRQEQARLRQQNKPEAEVQRELAGKYGIYVVPAKEVHDYHTQSLELPGALFKSVPASAGGERQPDLRVRVKVDRESITQFVGMARPDFYVRLDDDRGGAQNLWFALNFYKGAFGVWLLVCLVVGLAVAASTYLSGVITWLLVAFVLLCGVFREHFVDVAEGRSIGGAGMESLVRLSQGINPTVPMEDTASKSLAETSDAVFRWGMRRVISAIPDVSAFTLSHYVEEGFNISGADLFISFLYLLGYLVPAAVLGYYLIRWREIASTM